MGNELIDKYAFEAVDLIRKKEVSSSELLKASQERHIEVDEQVNALPYTFYDKALTKAKNINIDSERQNKKSLLGLPIAVKDYNDVAGVPTTFGSKIFSNNIPSKSDSTIARLEQMVRSLWLNQMFQNGQGDTPLILSLIHISEPTRP